MATSLSISSVASEGDQGSAAASGNHRSADLTPTSLNYSRSPAGDPALQDPAVMEQRLEMMLRAMKELRVQKEAGSSATPSPSSAPPQQGQQHLQVATPSPVSMDSTLPSS